MRLNIILDEFMQLCSTEHMRVFGNYTSDDMAAWVTALRVLETYYQAEVIGDEASE